jgi:hypothetical protein
MATWSPCLLVAPPDFNTMQMAHGPMNVKLTAPSLVPEYKMTGYYATGLVYESWTSFGFPNTTPPSGHTLTNITYVRLV